VATSWTRVNTVKHSSMAALRPIGRGNATNQIRRSQRTPASNPDCPTATGAFNCASNRQRRRRKPLRRRDFAAVLSYSRGRSRTPLCLGCTSSVRLVRAKFGNAGGSERCPGSRGARPMWSLRRTRGITFGRNVSRSFARLSNIRLIAAQRWSSGLQIDDLDIFACGIILSTARSTGRREIRRPCRPVPREYRLRCCESRPQGRTDVGRQQAADVGGVPNGLSRRAPTTQMTPRTK
jgi:hypothetical protein